MVADYITRGISKYHGPIRISHKGLWLHWNLSLKLSLQSSPLPQGCGNPPWVWTSLEQDTHTAQALWLKGHIYSRNNAKEPTTQAAFSQPGPLCCPMSPGEPPGAYRTLGHRAHPSTTQTALHGQATPSCIIPQASSKPQLCCFCAWQVPAASYLWSSSCQWITPWW